MSGFCARCGGPLRERPIDHRTRPACDACGLVAFLDPKVAVAAVLELGGGILLGRRAIEPGLGRWSFPGGFVDRGEELTAALRREIVEETGLTAEIGRLIGVYSAAGNPVVLIVYAARAEGVPRVSAEASALEVFDPAALPDMAFAHDRRIIHDWQALRRQET